MLILYYSGLLDSSATDIERSNSTASDDGFYYGDGHIYGSGNQGRGRGGGVSHYDYGSNPWGELC